MTTTFEPVTSPGAKPANEIHESQWVYTLSAADIAEIDHALEQVELSGSTLETMQAEDFPIDSFSTVIDGIGDQLDNGLGFILIKGLDVYRYTQAQAELIFYGLGLHLGLPMIQNDRGHLLGHVLDEGKSLDDKGARGYQTNASLSLHSDRFSDIVGLLCWRQSAEGGESIVVSTEYLFNQLLDEAPHLAQLLFEPWPWMQRDETKPGNEDGFEMSPLAEYLNGRLYCRLNRAVLEKTQQIPGAPEISPEHFELLRIMDEIAERPGVALSMKLEPGDIQLLNNYAVVHGRGHFIDGPDGEAGEVEPRHLFRLWLERASMANPSWTATKPYSWLRP